MPRTAITSMLLRLLTLMLCLLNAWPAQAQEARAWFDRNPIFEDETAILNIEVDEQMQPADLKTSLLEQDFNILSNSTGHYLRMENGRMTAKSQWTLQLEPKHSGAIELPSLAIGQHRTPPLRLQVQERPPEQARQAAEDVLLEVEIEPENPYVQSQVRLSVRLMHAAPLQQGSLNEPEPENALIQRLGDDISYQTTRGGRNYRAIERRYALFPEKSGPLIIPAFTFEGRVADPRSYRSRRMRLASESKTLEVRPRPPTANGEHWLPAVELSLREAWPEEPPQFRVGEPVTRTLILEAKGLSAAQLPELAIPEIPQTRTYPDQASNQTRTDGAWVYGRREQRLAIVPIEAGEFTLPEIRLRWWDVIADEARVAVLPARTISVLPSLNAPPPSIKTEDTAVEPIPAPAPAASIWPWLSAALLILWLATLLAWLHERRRTSPEKTIEQPAPALNAARRTLKKACADDDPRAAAAALLAWAAAVWPERTPNSLGALAARLDISDAPLRELDRALYAPTPVQWRGTALWEALKPGLTAKPSADSRRETLPPLYPERK